MILFVHGIIYFELYMSYLLLYLFVSIGTSCIWSLSDLFLKPRNIVAKYFPSLLRKMLLCMECSSFWIGILISIFICPVSIPTYDYPFISDICGGVITYLFVKILNNFSVLQKD